MSTPENHVIVLFGATGDLAKRKLIPGLYHLAVAGLLPERYRIVGSSPAKFALTTDGFRAHARDAINQFGRGKTTGKEWKAFEGALSFGAADPDKAGPLVDAVESAERDIGGQPRRLFHLAVPPPAFASVIEMLGASGLAGAKTRVIVEKPFGTDLATARALNKTIQSVFDESQIFRIDHFLGKESVDNILALRFANGFFEPVWSREHISHVQVDVPETLSIEGRAAFYEGTGAYRDMIVTHLFQVLGFVAMESPDGLDAKYLREEKTKVFDAIVAIDPANVVRGQYDGYRSEPGVADDSQTETFVALRVEIDNQRWSGVPFYLRTGKRLSAGRQVVTLGFREPPQQMFPIDAHVGRSGRPNELVIDFADPGSIALRFLAKEPGAAMRLGAAMMTFHYEDSFCQTNALQGYERLIHDALLGHQALFTTAAGIERLWEVSAPLLGEQPPVQPYAPGSWGPKGIDKLIAPHRWHLPAT